MMLADRLYISYEKEIERKPSLEESTTISFLVLVIFGSDKKSRPTPTMARGTIVPTLWLLLLVVCCATAVVYGKEWTVGDNKGWSFRVSGWERGKHIQSGDVLGENSKDQVIGCSRCIYCVLICILVLTNACSVQVQP